ncbi:MAG: nuclear transport factor 2 family protein [Opitutaceae bacterium]
MKMNLRSWAALAAFAACTCPVHAEPPVISALRADKARLAAMVAGDGEALGRLMSDQLRFVHSDGRVESKGDYVKNLMAGDTQYADAKTSELETTQVSQNVVVVLGVQEMRSGWARRGRISSSGIVRCGETRMARGGWCRGSRRGPRGTMWCRRRGSWRSRNPKRVVWAW